MSFNAYKRLIDLLPQHPLQVGAVIAVDNGVCTIQMDDGSTDMARGEAAVNDRVFFRDGLIEGPAPALTLELIEV